jgi:hypothetical protein
MVGGTQTNAQLMHTSCIRALWTAYGTNPLLQELGLRKALLKNLIIALLMLRLAKVVKINR